jgi:hypothetical protein
LVLFCKRARFFSGDGKTVKTILTFFLKKCFSGAFQATHGQKMAARRRQTLFKKGNRGLRSSKLEGELIRRTPISIV